MKIFYCIALFLGIIMVLPLSHLCMPYDAFVAINLSQAPDQWNIVLNEDLASRLSHGNVKDHVVTALRKRAEFKRDLYVRNLLAGCTMIAFSFIGLFRERQITKLKKPSSGGA